MGPLYKHYFLLHLMLKGCTLEMIFFFSLKGLQTPMETAGKDITSFKVEPHLKDGCVKRKTLKGSGRRELSVCTGMFGANNFNCLSVSYQLCWMLAGRSRKHFLK